MNPDNKACIAELRISVETRCRPDLDDIDSANILSVIESLQSHIAKLEAENARLKKVTHVSLPTNTMEQWVASEIRRATSYIKEQLAASQLREIQLREALEQITKQMFTSYKAKNGRDCYIEDDSGELCYIVPHEPIITAQEAISTKTDTSALDAYVAEKVKISRDIDEKQIAYLFEERSLLTRQRDLAVEALEITVNSWSEQFERHGHLAPEWAVKCRNALSAIKESEGK